MVRASLLALALVSISSVVGCGASATRHSATTPSAIARDESSWCSPEEAETRMLEKAAEHAPVNGPASTTVVQSYRHNEGARPTKGAVHAATY
ncbi:MAG: hypothetical protein JST00_48185 [Deltaproteobacteria bacterium]|nr:hypothetical protein [Deltaproteobacteria bacterium]